MGDKRECDFRYWTNFWSCVDKDGNRYRHQVRKERKDMVEHPGWLVRTEVLEPDLPVYHTGHYRVTDDVGKALRAMRLSWTNVGEEGRPMFPPGFEGGFFNGTTPNALRKKRA